jgi:ankyrin repeat protein
MNYHKLAILLLASCCLPLLHASNETGKKKFRIPRFGKSSETELHKAVEKGNTERVISLIEKGADVNLKDKYGQTPLHIAARDDKMTIIDLLLNKTLVDLDLQDKNGFTPLSLAVLQGNIDIAKRLLYAGARVDLATEDGSTPLLEAVLLNNIDMARLLIEYDRMKATINSPNKNGSTPLDFAEGQEMIDLLKDHGAKKSY